MLMILASTTMVTKILSLEKKGCVNRIGEEEEIHVQKDKEGENEDREEEEEDREEQEEE